MAAALPSTLRLGSVHLAVSELDRSLVFYRGSLGLDLHWRDAGRAALGAGDGDLLVLEEEPGARPAGRHAGLYHVALLLPARIDLARALRRLAVSRARISGASDHGTHDAIYLSDPDGNGLELAADNPRELWPNFSDTYALAPAPLDLRALLALAGDGEPEPRVAPGTSVGHVHLHVGDIERGLAFYRDVIGFELQARLPTAAFVSANGYHHHLAFNTWQGEGVPPAPAGVAGLRRWTLELGSVDDVEELRARAQRMGLSVEKDGESLVLADPWQIPLHVRACEGPTGQASQRSRFAATNASSASSG